MRTYFVSLASSYFRTYNFKSAIHIHIQSEAYLLVHIKCGFDFTFAQNTQAAGYVENSATKRNREATRDAKLTF